LADQIGLKKPFGDVSFYFLACKIDAWNFRRATKLSIAVIRITVGKIMITSMLKKQAHHKNLEMVENNNQILLLSL
jgi:hypothetical protein